MTLRHGLGRGRGHGRPVPARAEAYSAQTIAPGDHVAITGGRWHRVIGANKATVTLQIDMARSARAPYHHVIGHRPTPTVN